MKKSTNFFTIVGIITVIYLLVWHILPAVVKVTTFIFWLVLYTGIVVLVIILIIYAIGIISRRIRK